MPGLYRNVDRSRTFMHAVGFVAGGEGIEVRAGLVAA